MTEHNPRLVFVGYTNIDENRRPDGTTILPGGAAYFGSVTASLVSEPIGLVTRIGEDFDRSLLQRVSQEGIHVIHGTPNGRSTQVYHSLTDLTQRDIFIEWGVNPDLNPQDFPSEWLESAAYIHIATMPPLQQRTFIEYLREHAPQAKLSIDTDLIFLQDEETRALVADNFKQVDLAFVNRREYDLLKDVVDTREEAIVKLDEEGAVYLRRGVQHAQAQTRRVDAVDVTGAGDIFAGTFLSHRTNGNSVEAALQEATSTATTSVTQVGISHLFE